MNLIIYLRLNFLKYVDEFDNYEGDDATDLIEKKEISQDKDN